MKLPRHLAAADLEKALRKAFGYQFSRPSGGQDPKPASDQPATIPKPKAREVAELDLGLRMGRFTPGLHRTGF